MTDWLHLKNIILSLAVIEVVGRNGETYILIDGQAEVSDITHKTKNRRNEK